MTRRTQLALSYVEKRYVADIIIPRSADDLQMKNGYRCIPIPPTADDGWTIFDSSKKRRTGWMRVVYLDR
jgi:hypothetical protein